jgi:hypothetical protein
MAMVRERRYAHQIVIVKPVKKLKGRCEGRIKVGLNPFCLHFSITDIPFTPDFFLPLFLAAFRFILWILYCLFNLDSLKMHKTSNTA